MVTTSFGFYDRTSPSSLSGLDREFFWVLVYVENGTQILESVEITCGDLSYFIGIKVEDIQPTHPPPSDINFY